MCINLQVNFITPGRMCPEKDLIAVMRRVNKSIEYASRSGRCVQKNGQSGSDRQMDNKSRAVSWGAFDFNLSAVLGDHLVSDRQSQTGAFVFGCEKRIEDIFQFCG